MNEKKVIVFIVEEPSDEAALGTIMKEYFSDDEVQVTNLTQGDERFGGTGKRVRKRIVRSYDESV